MTLATDMPAAATAPPPPSGAALYFDGTCSARNDVVVETTAAGLQIFSSDRHLLDEWLYAELRRQAAPDGVLRLGRHGETMLARLEIRDAALASAIEDRAVTLDRGGAAERRLRRQGRDLEPRRRGVADLHRDHRRAGAGHPRDAAGPDRGRAKARRRGR